MTVRESSITAISRESLRANDASAARPWPSTAQVQRAAAAASHVCSASAAGRTGVALDTRRGLGSPWTHAEDVEHIAEVETDRSHAQLDLAVRGRGALLGLRHEPEVRHRAARVEVHPNRPAD